MKNYKIVNISSGSTWSLDREHLVGLSGHLKEDEDVYCNIIGNKVYEYRGELILDKKSLAIFNKKVELRLIDKMSRPSGTSDYRKYSDTIVGLYIDYMILKEINSYPFIEE